MIDTVLRASSRYNISMEYSVPFNITDEPIIVAAHKSAFVIRMDVDFILFPYGLMVFLRCQFPAQGFKIMFIGQVELPILPAVGIICGSSDDQHHSKRP